MSAFENSAAYKKGVVGEQTVEQWLRDRGFFVVRLCNIRNHEGIGAPMMMGAKCNLVLPDFQVISAQREPFYVEVKFKELAPESYVLRCPVHGIGARNFEHYKRVGLLAKCPVWLLILEDLSGELLGLRMNTATPDQTSDNDKMNRGGMVFFKRSRFVMVAQLERRQERLEFNA